MAAESPWSNGVVEHHNAVIGNMVDKITIDTDCSFNRDCLGMVSPPPPPNQLAFGHNPNLPFCLNDKPPALEGTTSSEVVAKILIALHAACKACIENDTSEKLRRALRHKIRPITTMTHQ